MFIKPILLLFRVFTKAVVTGPGVSIISRKPKYVMAQNP
jgi:hypothetical protein